MCCYANASHNTTKYLITYQSSCVQMTGRCQSLVKMRCVWDINDFFVVFERPINDIMCGIWRHSNGIAVWRDSRVLFFDESGAEYERRSVLCCLWGRSRLRLLCTNQLRTHGQLTSRLRVLTMSSNRSCWISIVVLDVCVPWLVYIYIIQFGAKVIGCHHSNQPFLCARDIKWNPPIHHTHGEAAIAIVIDKSFK